MVTPLCLKYATGILEVYKTLWTEKNCYVKKECVNSKEMCECVHSKGLSTTDRC